MKSILAPLDGNGMDAVTLGTALSAARMFGAHVDALHVRPDPDEIAASIAGPELGTSWGLESLVADLQARASEREEQAKGAFERFCAAEHLQIGTASVPNGVSASFLSAIGRQRVLYPELGRTSDLVVLGVPQDERELSWDMLQSTLCNAGRPLMLARASPPDPQFKTIAIAWKDAPEAARAVAVAGTFIARARHVLVFCVDEEDYADAESASRLARTLQRYNSDVIVERLYSRDDRSHPATLLEAAAAAQAGLLVTGGYGHSRMREWVFGGFTNHILRRATLPVLMMH